MTHAIAIPKLGLTMEEATVVEWHHADGEHVAKGETVVTIETDKVMFDVEAEADGFLERVAPVDARLPVGGLVGYLHSTAESAIAGLRGAAGADASVSTDLQPGSPVVPSPPALVAAAASHPAVLAAGTTAGGQRLMVSPVARRIAGMNNIDLEPLAGSGPGGVILKRDVESAMRSATSASAPVVSPAPPGSTSVPDRRPMSAMRRAISQRMMNSLSTTAQMTGFGRVDMAEATRLRQSLVAAADLLGARITYTDIVLKAAATVLVGMPEINSYIDGNDIVTWSEVNIGLAVAVDGGLIVPVIRQVDRLTLVELSHVRQTLITKARAGDLTRDDVEGGTFTVSNFGSYGGDFETPILNTPQSALLGIGKISDEPVVRDKQIVIRPMMAISLTFDHRLIDGALAGQFRARFKAVLEEPALLLARLR